MTRQLKIADPEMFQSFEGNIVSDDAEKSVKKYEDLKGIYESEDPSIDPDTVMYEVTSLESKEKGPGRLSWAVSLLHPVLVNGECCMTRSHFHKNENCDEYYWCAAGRGLLMLMDGNGMCRCEKMKKGSLHHIDGHLAHRLINTGKKDLKVICVWNADAGHDYERVEKYPFPFRVFRRRGKLVIEER